MNLLSLISSWLDIIYQVTTNCATITFYPKIANWTGPEWKSRLMFCRLECTNILVSDNNIWRRPWSFAAKITTFWNLKECHEICWGSSSQITEVARSYKTGAEGRWRTEVTFCPEDQRTWPKVIPSAEDPRKTPKVLEGERRSTADPKVTSKLRSSVSIRNRIG